MNPKTLPEPAVLLELEPEEIGMLILTSFSETGKEHPQNFFSSNEMNQYMGPQDHIRIKKVLMEGWSWLVSEGLIVRQPDESSDWFFVSRRGLRLRQSGDLKEYLQTKLLAKGLDPVLEANVRALYLRGSLDASVFPAFKEVEVRMRTIARLGNEYYGIKLVKKCFGPEDGILIDQNQEPAERDSLFRLFLGSIGLFKNPHSHRNIELPPDEAAVLINFADYLLKIIEGRRSDNTGSSE